MKSKNYLSPQARFQACLDSVSRCCTLPGAVEHAHLSTWSTNRKRPAASEFGGGGGGLGLGGLGEGGSGEGGLGEGGLGLGGGPGLGGGEGEGGFGLGGGPGLGGGEGEGGFGLGGGPGLGGGGGGEGEGGFGLGGRGDGLHASQTISERLRFTLAASEDLGDEYRHPHTSHLGG